MQALRIRVGHSHGLRELLPDYALTLPHLLLPTRSNRDLLREFDDKSLLNDLDSGVSFGNGSNVQR